MTVVYMDSQPLLSCGFKLGSRPWYHESVFVRIFDTWPFANFAGEFMLPRGLLRGRIASTGMTVLPLGNPRFGCVFEKRGREAVANASGGATGAASDTCVLC